MQKKSSQPAGGAAITGAQELAFCCEQCGAELLAPTSLCGFCQVELNLEPAPRECKICGCDISHRRGDAETCGPAHKRKLARQRSAPQSLDLDGRNPLVGVDPQILACIYQNGTGSPVRQVMPRPWRGEHGEIIRIDRPHARADEFLAPVVDLDSRRLSRRHARFVTALSVAARQRAADTIEVAA